MAHRFETDAQRIVNAAHFAGFNPDAARNPHDVDHTGPGQFKKVGRFDPLSSSVAGGIFGGEAEPRPRGNVAAVQRVKALPTGGGDFLDRLALAEARDDKQYAAGARPRSARRGASPRPASAYERAAQILNHHQAVADRHTQQQQERQWSALQKQTNLSDFRAGRDGGEGGTAAGAKSRSLAAHERQVAAAAEIAQQSWQQQHHRHEAQKRAEVAELQQTAAAVMRQQNKREAIQQQQAARAQALQHQSAMALQRQEQQRAAMQQQEAAARTSFAKNQAARRNSGSLRFG